MSLEAFILAYLSNLRPLRPTIYEPCLHFQVVTTPAENSYLVFEKGETSVLERITSTWGEMFGSSAVHSQSTALGEGIKSCTVGRNTLVTITTRDWQVLFLLSCKPEDFSVLFFELS